MRWATAAAALALVFVSCGGGGAINGIAEIEDLRNKTIGVASLEDTSTLELRYLLQELYGLDARREGGDVTLVEAPAQELALQLEARAVDAAILPPAAAREALKSDQYRVLSRITRELRDANKTAIMTSVLVTYADIAAEKTQALLELNRLLGESEVYLDANREQVVASVAAGLEIDAAGALAWWDGFRLRMGDLSPEVQDEIAGTWRMALMVGVIAEVPALDEIAFMAAASAGATSAADRAGGGENGGDRITVSLAVLDDPSRRAALFAIEQGIVESDTIDLDITYLTSSALAEAAPARQHDVVETTPLAVPLGMEREIALVILSGAVEDVDGTLLFVSGG